MIHKTDFLLIKGRS